MGGTCARLELDAKKPLQFPSYWNGMKSHSRMNPHHEVYLTSCPAGSDATEEGERMPEQKKLRRAGAAERERRRRAAVLQAANGHIVRHFPFGCLGGTPRRLVGEKGELWIVPVVLTSPGYGAVGEVGLVAVDARTGRVVNGSDRHEVARAIKHLKEAKRDALEAAFRQARTV